MTSLVIVQCSSSKAKYACRAREMYRGSIHRQMMQTAARLRPNVTLIMSAKYGLVFPSSWIRPYNLRLGEPGCVTESTVREQVAVLDLLGAEPVVFLGGTAYAELLKKVWPHVRSPLAGDVIARSKMLVDIARRGSA